MVDWYPNPFNSTLRWEEKTSANPIQYLHILISLSYLDNRELLSCNLILLSIKYSYVSSVRCFFVVIFHTYLSSTLINVNILQGCCKCNVNEQRSLIRIIRDNLYYYSWLYYIICGLQLFYNSVILYLLRKKKYHFLYGKWTEFIRVTDINSYEEYAKENADKFR